MDLFKDNLDAYKDQGLVIHDSTIRKQRDIGNLVHISDRDVPPRAVAVLPSVLQMRRDVISPRRPLPSRIRFGPVRGVLKTVGDMEVRELIKKSIESKTPLFLLKSDQIATIHIDQTDQDKANWLGLLPLGDHTTANVWLYVQDKELYAVTTKSIPSRVPLVIGYSNEYVKMHGFPPETPSIDLHEDLSSPPHKWWCYECERAMPSAALLQHHVDCEHKDDKMIPRRRHRCQRCKRTFARLFTLKRHKLRYCTHKARIQSDTTQYPHSTVSNDDPESNYFLNESRVSLEDILNLSSNTDFHSLLDTNPSLDSSSSKSTDQIEPDNQLSKDITNDPELNFVKNPTIIIDKFASSAIVYKETAENIAVAPAVDSGRRACEAIACAACPRQYATRAKLLQHVRAAHPAVKTAENSDIMYKCEDCQLIFKRRGMFVNHLWRVHQNVTTAVPLERRERRYPCAACPKLYRSAAKRDRHLRNYHPGVANVRAIDSGRRACEAAACAACPRQYATRAKLLQHVRAAHPAVAPPVKKNARAQVTS